MVCVQMGRGEGVISVRLEGGVEEGGDYKEQERVLHGREEEEKPEDPGNGWREGGCEAESWNGGKVNER